MEKKFTASKSTKKQVRNIVLIGVGVLAILFFYGRSNFETDKQALIELKTKVANGGIKPALEEMKTSNGYSNPLINIAYKKWKKEIEARFVTKEEVMENTSGNKIVHDISTIYREYWRSEIIKETKDRTDTTLYHDLVDYLVSNKLSDQSRDSLAESIQNDRELKRIIEAEGFKTRFIYRNGFQDLFIWNSETIQNFEVFLPKDTIDASVIFIESYHLNGYDNYVTVGSSQVGGWALKESPTLYCNSDLYNVNSESFKVSYLKHETLHYVDLNAYPNLSSADLEYRAKVIEMMYCTERTVYDKISEFAISADPNFRSHSHPYANYALLNDLSELLFGSPYDPDRSNWKNLSVESINEAATALYQRSEATLLKDKNVKEVI